MWQVLDLLKKVDLNMLKAGTRSSSVPLLLSVPFSASAADQQWNEFLSPHMKPFSCLKFGTFCADASTTAGEWQADSRKLRFLANRMSRCHQRERWSLSEANYSLVGKALCEVKQDLPSPVGSLEHLLLLDWFLLKDFATSAEHFTDMLLYCTAAPINSYNITWSQ